MSLDKVISGDAIVPVYLENNKRFFIDTNTGDEYKMVKADAQDHIEIVEHYKKMAELIKVKK